MYFCAILMCYLLQLALTYSVQEESKLHADLLTDYNANVRPSDQVYVTCSLSVRNVLYLDIVEQTLAITGALAVAWQDDRLSWNVTERGDVTTVYFKPTQVWRPSLVLQNSATGIEALGDDSNQQSIPLLISPGGSVFWLAPAYFVSYCSVDVAQFPFDTQTCELKISGWLYTTESLRLISMSNYVFLDLFEENGEYDIIGTYTRVDRTTLQFFYVETLVFGLELRRKYSYYLLNIVLPVFFMQLLGLVVFLVPAESGEKLTFALTLLLSLTVMMTLVAANIPTTSLQIPTLSIYMFGGTFISALEVIMTVVILYVKHHYSDGVHIGKKMQAFLYTVGLLTCRRKNKVESEKDKLEEIPIQNIVVTNIETLARDDNLREKKVEISNIQCNAYDDNDMEHSPAYTANEISAMLDKMCLIVFTSVILVFTLAMLYKVL